MILPSLGVCTRCYAPLMRLKHRRWFMSSPRDDRTLNNTSVKIIESLVERYTYVIKMTELEKNAFIEKEFSKHQHLSIEEQELRGLAIHGLRVCHAHAAISHLTNYFNDYILRLTHLFTSLFHLECWKFDFVAISTSMIWTVPEVSELASLWISFSVSQKYMIVNFDLNVEYFFQIVQKRKVRCWKVGPRFGASLVE